MIAAALPLTGRAVAGYRAAMPLSVMAPVSGEASSLEDAPDPIFSMGALGWGVALDPPRERISVIAPIDGTIERIEPHVFSIAFERGCVMVQVGINADSLGGEGYEVHVQQGDKVDAGDPIVSFNPAEIEAKGVNPMVLVVALDCDEFTLKKVRQSGSVTVGDTVFVIP